MIAVLWLAVVVSALFAGALAMVRVETRGARARSDAFLARTAAQSGLDIAGYRIASGIATSIDALTQSPVIIIDNSKIRFEHSPEDQKLDINLANESAFETLFEFVGLKKKQAERLAARIADWRDDDDLSRPNGAEARDYAAAKNGETIANRSFRSVQELMLVLDFPIELFNCVAPAMTVSGTSGYPSEALMRQLYGDRPNDAAPSSATDEPQPSERAGHTGSRFAITVVAETAAGRKERLTGLFRINTGAKSPYQYITVFPPPPESQPDCAALQSNI